MTSRQNQSIVSTLRIMVAKGDTACLIQLKIGRYKSIYQKRTKYKFKCKAKCARGKLYFCIDLMGHRRGHILCIFAIQR